MMTVMIKAAIFAKPAAPWKMVVLATSIVRAKHLAWIPVDPVRSFEGPTSVHSGRVALVHTVSKSPNPILGGLLV